MSTALYTTGAYLAQHPSWHVEDSAWKAEQILQILYRNNLSPDSVCEVGCGVGAVLESLQPKLKDTCNLYGYEISPQAYARSLGRSNQHLHFVLGDYLHSPSRSTDLLMLVDVVEHIQDFLGFLVSLRGRARHTLIHVPLDLSFQALMRNVPRKVRASAGHLHYFTKDLFLDALKACGYSVIDWAYTAAAIDRPSSSVPMTFAKWPRRLLFSIQPDLATLVLGGYSLLVLAE